MAITSGEPAPAQWRLGVLRDPTGSQTLFPEVKWELTVALSAAGSPSQG